MNKLSRKRHSHANASELSEARAAWDSDGEFVAQIAYQLRFRASTDFMSMDLDYLGKLLLDRPENMGSQSMGLYMTDAEVAEMERGDALGDQMERVIEAVTGVNRSDIPEGEPIDFGPNFVGIWMDQLDGGKVALAVVDASELDVQELQQIVGGEQNLKIVEWPYSYGEIETYKQMLAAEASRLGIPFDIAAMGNDEGRLIEVRVQDPARVPVNFGAEVPDGAFDVVEGPVMSPAQYPHLVHTLANQMPGLWVDFRLGGAHAGMFTWGFNGHTPDYHYIVTCGHCMAAPYNNWPGSWVGNEVEFWQGGSSARLLTPGTTYIVSIDTENPGWNYDTARAESSYANDNCYHGDPPTHCEFPMAQRASVSSWDIGSDRTCAGLPGTSYSGGDPYQCGWILEINANGGNRVRTDIPAMGGDSGAGMKWEYRIDGVLTDIGGGSSYFQQAYHIKYQLGNGDFDFNCASGRQEKAPSQWGTCPDVDA